MNTAAKCECCVCEPVCKYKDTYLAGIEAIMGAQIPLGETENGFTFWEVKNCPHIEVSIKCPHMVAKTRVRESSEGQLLSLIHILKQRPGRDPRHTLFESGW